MKLWACLKCTFRTEQPDCVSHVSHRCYDNQDRTLKNITPPKVNIRDAIVAESMARFPQEACGFILSYGTMVIAQNVSQDPGMNFEVDAHTADLWWPTGKVAGVWHSHCFDPAVPSTNDQALAQPGLECWIYSVMDEQLGIYKPDRNKQLQLIAMEDLTP